MPIDHKALRRQYQAACVDRTPERFMDNLREGLEQKHIKPIDFSLAGLFEAFVEDGHEILTLWRQRQRAPQITSNQSLAEAVAGFVSTAQFAEITGQLLFTEMMEGFKAPEFVFSQIVPNRPTQFNGEKIPGLQNIGDQVEIVGEGDRYPELGFGQDWIETPETQKRGGIVSITKEAIFFDRTGMVLEQGRGVGTAMGLNKEKRIIDAAIDENSTRHRYKWRGTSYATFQSSTPWINLKTSNGLVDWTDVDNAEQLFNDMVDPFTGEPIMIEPKHLITTRQLKYTAARITNSTELRFHDGASNTTQYVMANPIQGYQWVSSQLLAARMATDTTWYLGDITKLLRYMENWAITPDEQNQSSDASFEQDIVQRFKASERGTPVVMQPRAMVKNTVA